MRKTHVTIVLSLLLILAALLLQRWVGGTREGFQGSTLPTGTQTVTDFVIYSNMNTIAEKLPFLHTSFTDVNLYDTASLTSPLTMAPTGTPSSTINLRNLITSDSVNKLIVFKLKTAITGPIDQTAVDALNDASTNLFGAPGKIAFKTTNGNLYPSIVLPAPTTPTPPATPPATPSTPADDYYNSDDPTDTTLYYIKTVSGATTKYTVNTATINTAACGKTIPTITNTKIPAATLAAITTSQPATCTDLP